MVTVQLRSPIIARAIIRNGKLDSSRSLVHDSACLPISMEKIESEQIVREQRKNVGVGEHDITPKTHWRKVKLIILLPTNY